MNTTPESNQLGHINIPNHYHQQAYLQTVQFFNHPFLPLPFYSTTLHTTTVTLGPPLPISLGLRLHIGRRTHTGHLSPMLGLPAYGRLHLCLYGTHLHGMFVVLSLVTFCFGVGFVGSCEDKDEADGAEGKTDV